MSKLIYIVECFLFENKFGVWLFLGVVNGLGMGLYKWICYSEQHFLPWLITWAFITILGSIAANE